MDTIRERLDELRDREDKAKLTKQERLELLQRKLSEGGISDTERLELEDTIRQLTFGLYLGVW